MLESKNMKNIKFVRGQKKEALKAKAKIKIKNNKKIKYLSVYTFEI